MKRKYKTPIRDRFEYHVMPEPNTGCWIWTGSLNLYGYGQFKMMNKIMKSHRVSHIIYKGEIPKGYLVCHKCDNKYCVNPDHLFLGTHKDNTQDMISKGRIVRNNGMKHWKAKLTDSQVSEIRFDYLSGMRQVDIAKKFQTNSWNVYGIVHLKRRNKN